MSANSLSRPNNPQILNLGTIYKLQNSTIRCLYPLWKNPRYSVVAKLKSLWSISRCCGKAKTPNRLLVCVAAMWQHIFKPLLPSSSNSRYACIPPSDTKFRRRSHNVISISVGHIRLSKFGQRCDAGKTMTSERDDTPRTSPLTFWGRMVIICTTCYDMQWLHFAHRVDKCISYDSECKYQLLP